MYKHAHKIVLSIILLIGIVLAGCPETSVSETAQITFTGARSEVTSKEYSVGEAITLEKPEQERPGYVFSGWNTQEDGSGTSYLAGSTLTVTADLSVHAQWKPASYTITFDGNGATSTAPDPMTGDYDTTITLPAAPTRTGYTFTEWNTEQVGTEDGKVDASYTITGNATLYAQWTLASYTITFDGNGATFNGNGADSSPTQEIKGGHGTSITLPTAPTRTGYTFTEWNTKKDGNDGDKVDASYTITGDATLYARWSPISYTITFDGNEATSTVPDPETGDYDTSITLPPAPSRTGYTFTGWNTEQGGRTGTRYAAKASYTIKGNVTLYARWSPISYTITFDGNEATSTVPDPKTGDYDTSITLPPAPTRTGYTFTGWNTEQGGRTGTRYAAKASYTIKGNVTLYARWSPISYTITFDGNEATSTVPDPKTGDYDTSITLPPAPSRTGYTFTGWNTEQGGRTGTRYAAKASYTIKGNVTLYARWSPISYTITFDGNEATSTVPDPKTGDYDTSITLPPAPSRTGYTFTGWNTEQGGRTGTRYDAKASYTIKGNVTLYARWSPISYTITFDGNEATSTVPDPKTGDYDTSITLPPAPSRTGYTFTGWNTEQGGRTGTRYAAKASYTIKGNATLYARWSTNSYIVTFEGNGATSTVPGIMTGNYNTVINLPTAPSRTGYTFTGWNTEQVGTKDGKVGASYTITGHATLYAQWTLASYTITFEGNGEGASTTPSITGNYNTVINLPTAPSRTGYTFTGWNTEQVGTKDGKVGASYTITGNATLYAQWTAKSYTITFDGNEATSTVPDPKTGDYDTSITLPPAPSRTGHTFTGWNTEQVGTKDGKVGASYTITGNATLYAQWNPIRYTITFHPSGARWGSTTRRQHDWGSKITLPTASRVAFSDDKRSFKGWSTELKGGTVRAAGTSHTVNGDVTFFAQWTEPVTITFKTNGATHGSEFTKPSAKGATITLPYLNSNSGSTERISRTNYRFVEWNTKQDGSGTGYKPGDTYTVTTAITFYIIWKPIPYTISFDGNGEDSSDTQSISGGHGTSITLPAGPTRNIHYFTEWNTQKNGGGKGYDAGASYTVPLFGTTLYAQWTTTGYTITFDGNGQKSGEPPSPITGANVTLPGKNTLVKTGHPFFGWNTRKDGNEGTFYLPNANIRLTKDITLYAQYDVVNWDTLIKPYIEKFNTDDTEDVSNLFPNNKAIDFLRENIPYLHIPEKELEKTYYFRWWTFRKHIKQYPGGYLITEFLPTVGWAGKHNGISCPAGHHFYEGRWLHDDKYLKAYANYWFTIGSPRTYSFWAADSMLAFAKTHNLKTFITGHLSNLKTNYIGWNHKFDKHGAGLYKQTDNHDGMEYSIGGNGRRATINSYMYGDAMAISKIAAMAGASSDKNTYATKASTLKTKMLDKLWDTNAKFFKVLKDDGTLADVRELHGYTPWYFNIPDSRHTEAWSQLLDSQGFKAKYGPTSAERRHNNFDIKINYSKHECLWNGPSWPFATSITLKAMANLLRNYSQTIISKKDFLDQLRTYSDSHRRGASRTQPWIDENLHPDNGTWIAKSVLEYKKQKPENRGKDYNHSAFNDHIISDLIGVRSAMADTSNDELVIDPLLEQSTWDFFALDRVKYHGHMLTIIWDKDGTKYNLGRGFSVYIDGERKHNGTRLEKVTIDLKNLSN